MGAISLKKAEKPVVVATRTVDPYLAYSAHLAMHGFPLAAAAEGLEGVDPPGALGRLDLGWAPSASSGCHSDEDCVRVTSV